MSSDTENEEESSHEKTVQQYNSDNEKDDISPASKKPVPLNSPEETSFDELLSLCEYLNLQTTTPSGRDHKVGWYDIHDEHVSIAKSSTSEVVLIGDSIIAGLTRYPDVWETHFGKYQAVNLGIGGDRTQHVLWRTKNINLPESVKYLIIHCGTNNVDRDPPKDIANGIISIGLVCQERYEGLKVAVTGLLPRNMEYSPRRRKIKQVNRYLKQFCRTGKLTDFYYMVQDKDWTSDDGTLIAAYYYTDYLHLVESGNQKFAKSIVNIIEIMRKDEIIEYSDDEDDDDDFADTLSRKRFNIGTYIILLSLVPIVLVGTIYFQPAVSNLCKFFTSLL